LVNDSSGSEFLASSPAVNAVNTVGAGDALLAAVATRIHRGEAPAEWLAWGVASGSAATGCEAGVLPSQAEIAIVRRSVQVEQLS
jgi:fructose-1-phosphate kinase PfkB-like protein